jgi:sulfur transfer complex TusBCD TusB component (DsrH family)
MKTLQIIDTAYRATLEEQDDTVIWLTHVLRGAGADIAVLLRGNAVNYAVAAQQAVGLALGDWRQAHPPAFPAELKKLRDKGVTVFAVTEDVEERGIAEGALIDSVELVRRGRLAGLVGGFDRVWHW